MQHIIFKILIFVDVIVAAAAALGLVLLALNGYSLWISPVTHFYCGAESIYNEKGFSFT